MMIDYEAIGREVVQLFGSIEGVTHVLASWDTGLHVEIETTLPYKDRDAIYNAEAVLESRYPDILIKFHIQLSEICSLGDAITTTGIMAVSGCVWTHAFYKTCVQTAYNTACGQQGVMADTDEDLERWLYCPYCGRKLCRQEA